MTGPIDTNAHEATATTRREFLTLSGATAGMASFGMTAWADNPVEIEVSAITNTDYDTDVLVIGGGMAGLFAAVKAHDAGAATMIVSKGRLGSSGLTPFGKGFFVFDPETETGTIDDFVDTVSRSALGTNNPVYTRQLAEHSLDRARELADWGFFDQTLANRPFMKPIEERDIPLLERVVITHLFKEDGWIAGAAGFRLDAEETVTIRAKSVILCTGAGGFKPNGFPLGDLTHDGTVMAYRIGAKVTGKEWNDGHTTRSDNPAATFDGWGDMFERVPSTNGVEVHHDLGMDINYRAYVTGNPVAGGPGAAQPTDEVAGGPYVPEEFQRDFDAPGSGEGGAPSGPPPGDGKGGAPGGPPPGFAPSANVGGASAGMAIHKSEGLVPYNDRCVSNITGLYAAGDALGSHMAGGIYTQIGSSLAGSAVQGAIAGEAAADYAASVKAPIIADARIAEVVNEILAPLRREAGYGPAWVTQTLQGIMIPNFVLYIKKASMMQAALAYIEELRDHHAPMLRAANMHELRLAHETRNMILSAEMKLRASLMRTESRGSHYRLDYPDVDDVNWRAWINIYQGSDGSMQLEKQPFDTWPT
ncbi:Fumarate reductase flavoprotein subunit [Thalassovita gelatinovora]|uniref:Fumarate reductase flavoprotein subunit n=1 Tax=Thalassovita gelatinovora TaxID=53501 RepID=A0A0N7LVW4_THAGE|nr:FAD-binding protein [Thalassovita gelatinovora]QIZ81986.1 FAD-binding protein [Thalassovita gelatinovora]CUH67426.1 Fumarate reductase flavoprotein subunit [Thalassovita gelatinovora]SEP74251.1 Succinate dehydrogenase/fumarate reductase, flavoprotein subunit [Thalassovita gelatinovora]